MLERGMVCEHCGQEMLADWDCIPHHEIELTEENVDDAAVSLNPDNIKLVHLRCHNKIHERFGSYARHVYLVWGSPCAGKSTFVRNNCNDDDLIIDIDEVWDCICTGGRTNKPNRLKTNVFILRDTLMDQVRTRTGMWRNAYLVGTYPLQPDRERLMKIYGATEIHISTSKQLCISRADSPARRQYIDDYWEKVMM
jgi:predicted kinase